ncbi:PseE protein, putative pseudaminic acid transferase [Campylobacter pinnipediorum subsp. pinnipediorum]|uniref:motility associated factor glycosyltransferase family protein n=1 Tax=Campylobacter pinnipediorum TaxID=1965231 RepID=UPI000995C187|nr:6-hydroxymethylpterin diphosphokinase MptE-like protein [Campylobacter pinnipediorum]AQW83863.1 PseE protein, putative pseudaminic acid transferase [Campylobacter pinnipediorum subsp. pinnipediorum]
MNNTQDTIFEKNLQALFQQDEILAARLFAITSNEKYDVYIGKNDPIDINIIDKKTLKYVYNNPSKDVHDMLESLEKKYKRYPVMFFYGLGNGVLFKALLQNKTHQRIVVVEPELEIIYIALNLIDLSEDIRSERLVLFYSELATYSQFYFLASKSEFSVFSKLYDLHVHSEFYENFEEDLTRINADFTKAISQMVVSHGNSIDDNLQGIRQNLENIVHTLTNYSYVDLVKKRHKLMDTAVIVATGPSLDKQLPVLKKIAPYVSVISLDASYPILLKHGIVPDYVTSIERVVATSTFFDKKDKKIDKDIYFIVASLTHKETIKKILPRKLVLTMRPTQDEKTMRLDKFGYLGIGHSTANQAYQFAYVLGHKNIVLIGQDLAFAPDGSSHAKGHAFAQSDEFLYTTAYGGEGEVRTTYIWNLFKNQYEKDIENSSKEDVVTYNCTEGGARINGTIERGFEETMQELCKDKEIKNLPNINKVSYKEANKHLLKIYRYVTKKTAIQTEAKNKVEAAFLEITPKIDELLELKNNNKIEEKHFKDLVKISKKIDKLKDFLSSKRIMGHIENILTISVFYQELELAKIAVAPSDTTKEKIDKLLEWGEIHKYWMFSLAGGLDADIQTTTKASKNLIKELKKRNIFPEKIKPSESK